MRAVAFAAVLAALASPALASGGLSCEAEDEGAAFTIESGVTRGMGGPVFNFRAEVEIRDPAVAEDLRKLAFDGTNLPQYWLDGESLNLHLYRERAADRPHGYVELEVLTQAGDGDDEGIYDGTYVLTAFDGADASLPEGRTVTLEGTVSCFVE